ncbi:MAG: endonuclease domain-containing protein [Balneola sp.]|nr:endonuclease domain-containing protein [Balneola sp.]MBO6649986.1 endonuclease domain-containing protein [Balneola sp.]MBO6711664.1 endonuclease domain-containing protein [Balneola sp.]MBO6799860.1 endonuclease domain-containing protein [Balneola sp.]MBO6871103.1 endonuclease domain-containing protein [Balneola sp.]
MPRRKIIPYNPALKELARKLRNNATKAERVLWHSLSGKQCLGYDFHRQKPIGNYIVDFFCQELMLAIEVDGVSHNQESVQIKDRQKEEFLNSIGIDVLRFQDSDIYPENRDALRAIEEYVIEFEKINKFDTPPTPSQEGATNFFMKSSNHIKK